MYGNWMHEWTKIKIWSTKEIKDMYGEWMDDIPIIVSNDNKRRR